MILISAGLVLTAIVLLIAGFVLAKPFLVMWSIAVSVLSAVFLVIGALLRRHELFPGGDAGASQPLPQKGPMPAGPLPAPHGVPNHPSAPQQMMVRHGMQQAPVAPTQPRRGPVAGPATAAARRGALAPEAIVLVIPGRKRYHVAGCRQLAGRDHEELTHEEALEEGFTPCTTCLPADSASGPQPRETSPEARKPDEPLTASRESGPVAGAREPGAHEATARFTSPYRPVQPTAPSGGVSSGGQQTPGARPEPQRPESQRSESQRPGEQQGSETQRPETAASQGRFEASQTRAESPASPAFPVASRDAAPARPESSAGGRESTASRQETGRPEAEPSQQDPVVPVARPYVRSSEPQPRSSEPRPQPQKPASPPARPAEQPTRPAIQLPKIPEIPHAASEATSWFSRDVAAQAAGESREASAGSVGASAKPGSPKPEPDSAKAGPEPAASGAPGSSGTPATDASASRAGASDPDEPDAGGVASAKSGSTGSDQAEVEPTRPARTKPAKDEQTRSRPAEATSADSAKGGSGGGEARAEAVPGENASSAEAETTTAGRETSPEPSGSSGREDSATVGTPEPVEPAETAPGRAGRQVAADSTSAEPDPAPENASADVRSEAGAGASSRDGRDDGDAPDDRDDDTSPGGIPAIKDRPRPATEERETDGETVTVIAGTRRFHDSDCPLVKGASVGGSGVETTTRAEAERAGLSNCPICRIDRRT
ncbi:hypothetical protein ABT352_28970 [Streptosporangium sp. NPDC000563]|uniref:hypothetical protein n=1 Tax=Streptosporangium sp. NPDC000563 TaxID=3154366 RepID=UPI0033279660